MPLNLTGLKRLAVLVSGLLFALMSAAQTPGVSDKEITLGQSIYLTGALAELGKDFTAGAAAYFARVNAEGGLHGRRIRVITLDDAYDPTRALANVDELERQGVFALWQFAGTGTVREVAQVAARRKIPLVAAIATGPRLRSTHNPYTYYVRAGNREELQAIIDHLVVIGTRRIGVVYVEAPYGTEGFEETQAMAKASGLSLVASATIKTDGTGSGVAARRLLTADIQAVVMISVPASSRAFIEAARRVGLRSTVYSLNAGLPLGVMQDLGEDAHGVVVTQVMPNCNRPSIPVVREYQRDYRAAGHGVFTSASLEGYVNAVVLVEALRRTGRALTRTAFVETLDNLGKFDVGGFTVRYTPSNHGGSRQVELSMSGREGRSFVY